MKFTQFSIWEGRVYHPGVKLQNIIWYTGLLKMMKWWKQFMLDKKKICLMKHSVKEVLEKTIQEIMA